MLLSSSSSPIVASTILCSHSDPPSVTHFTIQSATITEDPFSRPFTYGSVPPHTERKSYHIGIPSPTPVAGALQHNSLFSYCAETFYVLDPKDSSQSTVRTVAAPSNENYTLTALGPHEELPVKHGMIIMVAPNAALHAITIITTRNVLRTDRRYLKWIFALSTIRTNVQALWDTILANGIDAFAAEFAPPKVPKDSQYLNTKLSVLQTDEELATLVVAVRAVKREREEGGEAEAGGGEAEAGGGEAVAGGGEAEAGGCD